MKVALSFQKNSSIFSERLLNFFQKNPQPFPKDSSTFSERFLNLFQKDSVIGLCDSIGINSIRLGRNLTAG